MLPEAFIDRMKEMLGDEFEEFLTSFNDEKYQALRVNTLKVDKEDFYKASPFELENVKWCENGFYYNKTDTPGKHCYHEAGVYYIQEPSAMLPGELMEAKQGERILDMCAAPGGKSTHIASYMKGEGILVCNEIHPARAKILSENIERMGIRNAIVTNESPNSLAKIFNEYFDRIMVDAPCSGEGMFRKNEDACNEWSPENVAICAERQDEILSHAHKMLKPGGRIVYSTCTFSREENEGTIERFVEKYPEYIIEKMERLWPHKVKGEGHFAAVLKKEGNPANAKNGLKNGCEKGVNSKEYKDCVKFLDEALNIKFEGVVVKFGEQIYLMPKDSPSLKGLKVLRPGLHLGELKKNRFEPSHSLALALTKDEVKQVVDLKSDDVRVNKYINGETFEYEAEKGWYLICVDGYSIAWGKLAGGIMKNHYPKGLRKKLL
ncbi:MAG: NOL1/NOP2/sun family putative RNA methylase [Lachnospiraceae bacterium]|nr:NOL1/NOP2/sun family putative RNA methylase [Lachnospiraceae bacterium]